MTTLFVRCDDPNCDVEPEVVICQDCGARYDGPNCGHVAQPTFVAGCATCGAPVCDDCADESGRCPSCARRAAESEYEPVNYNTPALAAANDLAESIAKKLGLTRAKFDALYAFAYVGGESGHAVACYVRSRHHVDWNEPIGRGLVAVGVLTDAEGAWLDADADADA